jgi:hypothetical protein
VFRDIPDRKDVAKCVDEKDLGKLTGGTGESGKYKNIYNVGSRAERSH